MIRFARTQGIACFNMDSFRDFVASDGFRNAYTLGVPCKGKG